MKVAHIGNTANNAYLNAKFLRRIGVEADAYYVCADFGMGHPEWEDAAFDAEVDVYNPPDWSRVHFTNGYVRPEWAIPMDGASSAGAARPVASAVRRRMSRRLASLVYGEGGGPVARVSLAGLLVARKAYAAFRLLSPERRRARGEAAGLVRTLREELAEAGISVRIGVGDVLGYRFVPECRRLARSYDVLQLYGGDAVKGPLLGKGARYVTFEHGTMRFTPFADTREGKLLAESYRRAAAVLITNADCLLAADRLGIDPRRRRFVPHPVDEEKYCPGETSLRGELSECYEADHIFLCPTRHDWGWLRGDSKRVEKALRAFVRFVRARPRSLLILCEWGHEVGRSKRLLEESGVAGKVLWVRPLPKMRLLDFYRAADAVLDQFSDSIGSFGALTAEALSCGKPVITYLNRSVHERCFREQPPTLDALEEDEILQRMIEVADDRAHAEEVGRRSREWILAHHGWRLVAERLRAVYERVLAGSDLADMEEAV